MAEPSSAIVVRRAQPADLDGAISLAAEALGWERGKPNDAFFRWKHLENPFGTSPMWLAECDGRLAGFRTFLRWSFWRPDGSVASAVRAVDTATHPDFQGRGIFTKLTRQAISELVDEGVDFVFNTPNDKSRPGYLKMGWVTVGRVPVHVRLAAPRSALRVARARVAAEKWSAPSSAGEPAAAVLQDGAELKRLLDAIPRPPAYVTERTPDYLRWRYGFSDLHYRAIRPDGQTSRGLCVFRVRRRGEAHEATICELLVPRDDGRTSRLLLDAVRRTAGADYLIWSGRRLPARCGFVPLPGQGPILTWRSLRQADEPPSSSWRLGLGDIELL
ncbi:MAG: GNAT family N-acetyltransferase [Actinobacteria bacterium]|nr:GNAT family N-acetyltransferase [Actinomycetota bacterium]